MKPSLGAVILNISAGFLLLGVAPAQEPPANSREADRLHNSALVIREAMGMHSRIPQSLLDKAYCVIVIPSAIKGAAGVGGSYGRGAMSCRGGADFKGPWTPPTMMALEGISFGPQIGGQATDFVLLVMNARGARSILSGKVKIGGDAAAAAGPVGRDAQANLDVYLRTTILSYSRSRGLFAGVSLEGSTLRPDNRANQKLYGKKLSARSIVLQNAVQTPPPAEPLISTLNQYDKNRAANRPPVAACSANPIQVISGSSDTVLVRAEASDPDNDPLTYTWTATGGTIDGTGPEVHWNPAGVELGAYTVTARVDDGRGGTANCTAEIQVSPRPNTPPTISCSASPTSVHPGDRVHIIATASDADNDPLTFTWQSNGGHIVGSGAEVDLDTAGLAPSGYTVSGHVDDGRGGTADCRVEITVEAPPAVEAKLAIHSIYFPTALPTRSKPDVGLLESQKGTLTALASDFKEYLATRPDAHLILEGHADKRGSPKSNKALSDRRVAITKRFLIGHGIPEANLETKSYGEEENLTTEQVKQLVEQHPNLSQEQKGKILSNLRVVTEAQNRRVDVTLSSTGQQSIRQFPFNAEDALTLLSPKRGKGKAAKEKKPHGSL